MNRLSRFFGIALIVWVSILYGGDNSLLMKMDAGLRRLVQDGPLSKVKGDQPAADGQDGRKIHILAEGGDCRMAIRQIGGHINTDLGTRVSARVPLSALSVLAENPGIRRLCLPHRYDRTNDRLTADIRADQVYNGSSPLTRSYTGKGVIIGIIDTGIDITHPDFQNADGTTRILSIWDQNADGDPPAGYDYGTEWTNADIDNGLCSHEDDVEGGHGTHVAGIAAGNGRAVGQYRGVAPEADLIVVADNDNFSGGFIDGVNYIFDRAEELGKPCVINASLGTHQGGHDGADQESRMMNQLVAESAGRALCASAGNEGDAFIHLSYPTDSDSFYTYVYPRADETVILYIRLPNDLLSRTRFAVGWNTHDFDPFSLEGGPIEFTGRTPWHSVQEIVDNLDIYDRARDKTGDQVGRVSFEFESKNDTITLFRIMIEDDCTWDEDGETVQNMDLWRFMVWQPDSRIDAWIANLGASYPGKIDDPDYLDFDNQSSVGLPALAHNVIAVGASVNRETFVDQYGDSWIFSEDPAGSLASFSSRGPTSDGRIKPDLVAPGDGVISALSAQAKNTDAVDPSDIVEDGQHMIASGTSMSCPAVAGCIALYLQQHPNAAYQQIRDALIDAARRDENTGTHLPDNDWGYGKADVFAMLTSGTDIDERKKMPVDFSLSRNFPNPFNDATRFHYSIIEPASVRLKIHDITGRCVYEKTLGRRTAGTYPVRLDAAALTSGVYLYTIESGNRSLSKKMVLMK